MKVHRIRAFHIYHVVTVQDVSLPTAPLPQVFHNTLPVLPNRHVYHTKSNQGEKTHTLCLTSVKSPTGAICKRYFFSLTSSWSCLASSVCAFLNADILRPQVGLSAKFLLWPSGCFIRLGSEKPSWWIYQIVYVYGISCVADSWASNISVCAAGSYSQSTHYWGKWFHIICKAFTECDQGFPSRSEKTVNIQVLSSTVNSVSPPDNSTREKHHLPNEIYAKGPKCELISWCYWELRCDNQHTS